MNFSLKLHDHVYESLSTQGVPGLLFSGSFEIGGRELIFASELNKDLHTEIFRQDASLETLELFREYFNQKYPLDHVTIDRASFGV